MRGDIKESLSTLASRLMATYRRHARRRTAHYRTTGLVSYDEFYPRHAKAILDEIDASLSEHYAFNEEELGYITHFDAKYRLGLGR